MMPSRLRWALSSTCLVWACTPSEPALLVPSPTSGSMVLISVDPGIEVIALEPGDQPYVAVPTGRHKDLYVVRYPCPLASVGMAPGPQSIVTGGEPLPPSTDLGYLTFGVSDLSPIDVLPKAILDLRFELNEVPNRCRHFVSTSATIGDATKGPIGMLFAYPGDRAVAVGRNGWVHSIAEDGSLPLPSLTIDRPLYGGFRAQSGRAIFTSSSASWIGSVELGLGQQVPFREDEDSEHVLDGDPTADLAEVFLVSSSGNFHRFDGSAWTQVAPGPPEGARDPGVVWMGPGAAAAIGVMPGALLVYRDGVLSPRGLPDLEPGNEPTAIGYFPGKGVAIGTRKGGVFIEASGNTWERLDGISETHVRHVVHYGGSLFHGGRSGVFAQYRPEHPACGAMNIAAGDTKAVVAIEHGLIMVTEGSSFSEVAVVAIDDTPSVEVCEGP